MVPNLLVPKYHGAAFYAHNAVSFDALFLYTWVQEHRDDFEFEVVPVQSSIQTIRVWRLPDEPEVSDQGALGVPTR